MATFVLRGNFLQQARGIRFIDTGSLVWTYDPVTNTISAVASGGGGGGTWGSIAGTLSDQTDLQAALDLKMTHPQVMARIASGF